METITYLNLKIEGTPITRVLELNIENGLDMYGKAYIEGETDYEEGNQFIQRVQSQTQVAISTTASGQPQKLFVGVVSSANIRKESEYAVLQLTLDAMAATLDKEKQNASYQKTGSMYEELINKSVNGKSIIDMQAADHATGSLVMQYNETPWKFAQRMASALGAPICANTDTEIPVVTIGMPKAGKTYQLSDVEYGYESDGEQINTMLTGTQAVQVGDSVSYGGSTDVVKRYCAKMQGGVLRTTVYVIPKAEAAAMNSGKADPKKQITNTQAAGKMFSGTVQEVKLDKVKVHLTDIDSSFDAGGDFWFPYSTAYSSSDGSGFYCMPAQGDTVRVFFPSDNEKDAFAASSVNVSPLDNPKHKKWRSPAGKEILLTEEGMFITCKEGKIFINMEDENGITIYSDKDINVNSMSNMTLYAQQGIKLQSENKILVSTGESYIDITSELIQMGAQQILIN